MAITLTKEETARMRKAFELWAHKKYQLGDCKVVWVKNKFNHQYHPEVSGTGADFSFLITDWKAFCSLKDREEVYATEADQLAVYEEEAAHQAQQEELARQDHDARAEYENNGAGNYS